MAANTPDHALRPTTPNTFAARAPLLPGRAPLLLSSGMSQQEIQDDFPELTVEDILAALAYAAEREHQVYSYKVQ